jgi:phosphohistidine swiveling domain-containing protein
LVRGSAGKSGKWLVLSEGFDAALTPFCSYYDAYVSFRDSIGLGVKDALVLFEGTHFWQGFRRDSFVACGKAAFAKFKNSAEYCARLEENHREGIRRMTAVAEKALDAAARRCSNEEAAELVREFHAAFDYASMWGVVISTMEYGDNLLSSYLLDYLKRIAPNRNPNELLEALTFCEEKTFIQQERAELLALLEEFKAQNAAGVFQKPAAEGLPSLKKRFPALARKLAAHARKWTWIAYSYTGPALDEAYFLAALKDAFAVGDSSEKIEFKKRGALKKRGAVEKELAPHALDEEHSRLVRVARIQPFLKAKRNEAMYYCDYAFDVLLAAFSKQAGVGVHELRFLLPDELAKALRAGEADKELIDLIKRRTKGVALVWEDGEFVDFRDGAAALEYKKTLVYPSAAAGGELKGICASAGKARGRVSIILSLNDFAKFRDGDVLVSVGTNPSMVPLMKRAAAIVTDVGGLTCHAAIVSRELGVPCVVATKAATKTLRDGDAVEVDATNGGVRKIS